MQICFGGTSSTEVNEFTSLLNLDTRSEDYNLRGDRVLRVIIVEGYLAQDYYMEKSMTIKRI